MKATLDRTGCISCGICAEICPEVFLMADDGVAESISGGCSEGCRGKCGGSPGRVSCFRHHR